MADTNDVEKAVVADAPAVVAEVKKDGVLTAVKKFILADVESPKVQTASRALLAAVVSVAVAYLQSL